jgi:hypothetical protein
MSQPKRLVVIDTTTNDSLDVRRPTKRRKTSASASTSTSTSTSTSPSEVEKAFNNCIVQHWLTSCLKELDEVSAAHVAACWDMGIGSTEEIIIAARDVSIMMKVPHLVQLFVRCGGRFIHVCYPRNPCARDTYYGWRRSTREDTKRMDEWKQQKKHQDELMAVAYCMSHRQLLNGDGLHMSHRQLLNGDGLHFWNDEYVFIGDTSPLDWQHAHPPTILAGPNRTGLVSDPRQQALGPVMLASTKSTIHLDTQSLDCYHIRLSKRTLPMFNALSVEKHIMPFLAVAKEHHTNTTQSIRFTVTCIPSDITTIIADYTTPLLWHQFFVDRISYNRIYTSPASGSSASTTCDTTIPARMRNDMLAYCSLQEFDEVLTPSVFFSSSSSSSSSSSDASSSSSMTDRVVTDNFLPMTTVCNGVPIVPYAIPEFLQPTHKRPTSKHSEPFSPKSPSYDPPEWSDHDDNAPTYSPTSPSYSPSSPTSHAYSSSFLPFCESHEVSVSYAPTSPAYLSTPPSPSPPFNQPNYKKTSAPILNPQHTNTIACTCFICAFDA